MNYWAFHCNPSSWDSISELKEYNDGTWLINKQHKAEIKVGDKFILWMSGKEAGVYAFGEVADIPRLIPEAKERARLYALDKSKFDDTALRVKLSYTDKILDTPILRSVILGSHWLAKSTVQYSFFDRPQGITSRDLTPEMYAYLLRLRAVSQNIINFKSFLSQGHKKSITSTDYLKMMTLIEKWFVEKGVCNPDFLIWESRDQVDSINKKLEIDLKIAWKTLNQDENNWYSAPWNKWVEFSSNGVGKTNHSEKYWLYSPGASAEKWEEFYSLGIMGLGWDILGDLNQYSTKKEIATKLKELENSNSDKKNDTNANYEFKNNVAVGDIIIIKKGNKELLGYGEVSSDYYYDDTRDSFQKCRKVNGQKKGNWPAEHTMAQKTLTDITKYPTEHPGFNKYYEWLLSIMNEDKKIVSQVSFPLNTIFYGPPGTGKTYTTLLRAAQIIEERAITD